MTEVETATPVEEIPPVKPEAETATDAVPVVETTEAAPKAPAATVGEELTKLEQDIINQIEYYFSDANLGRDKFLRELIGKDDGWVPFATLLTFKRLASLSSDAKVIADAVDKSDEGLVEISEDREKIRRHPERPLPEQNEEYRKELMKRTAYIKGFPKDAEMSQLIDFFKPFQKVTNIVMRKYLEKASKKYMFKGSVYVSFSKVEEMEDVLKKEKLEYNGVELTKMSEEDHFKEKAQEKADAAKKRGKYVKPEPTKFTLPTGTVILLESLPKDLTRENIKSKLTDMGAEVAYIDFEKGAEKAYVRLTEEGSAKSIFEKFDEGGKLKLLDGEAQGRLVEGDEEKTVLDGAVENMLKRRTQNKHHQQGRRQGGGRNQGRGDRHNNRKRKGSDDDDGPPAKQ